MVRGAVVVRASLVMRFLPAAFASAVLALVVATHPLAVIPRAIGVACVVAAWISAALFQRNEVRAHTTVVLAIATVIAAGQVDAGIVYGVACVIFLLVCVVSMRAARTAMSMDRDRPRQRAIGPAVVLLLAASVVTGTLVVGLPRLAERIERRISAMFGVDSAEATAFSTKMVLGSTRGMLQSDTIVMRIAGDRPDYLRGAVYDHYDPPFWVTTRFGRERHEVASVAPRSGAATTQITLVRGAPNGEDMRWFLPAGACDLGVARGKVEVDAFGVARRARGDDPPTLTYGTTDCAVGPAPVAPPSPSDFDLPPSVSRALAPIAKGWTVGATTDREKLQAIERELSRFEYSLAVEHGPGTDPVVDFVSVYRAGHCEMFASAMVLMARTLGIPARVVGGYRVTEVNPLTGVAVVRDRDAHAWVEAWVDGAWRGWDPTPASETFRRRAGAFDHAGDLLSSAFERMVTTLARLGLLGTAGVLVVVVVFLVAVRWLGARVQKRRLRSRGDAAASALPLPCFDDLTDALARAGHERDVSEPIEVFARRIERAPAAWARDASKALLEYASLRYGNVGDEAAVVRLLDRSARAIRAAEQT